MALLKKIKSATLVEAIVATVLIVIIFSVASLVLNNLIINTFNKNTHQIENRLNELIYDIENNVVKLPYKETYEGWRISVEEDNVNLVRMLNISAASTNNNKEITRKVIYEN